MVVCPKNFFLSNSHFSEWSYSEKKISPTHNAKVYKKSEKTKRNKTKPVAEMTVRNFRNKKIIEKTKQNKTKQNKTNKQKKKKFGGIGWVAPAPLYTHFHRLPNPREGWWVIVFVFCCLFFLCFVLFLCYSERLGKTMSWSCFRVN